MGERPPSHGASLTQHWLVACPCDILLLSHLKQPLHLVHGSGLQALECWPRDLCPSRRPALCLSALIEPKAGLVRVMAAEEARLFRVDILCFRALEPSASRLYLSPDFYP